MSALAQQRVLVTGGTGLVGGFVLEKLLERGAEPVVLVRDRVRGAYAEDCGALSRCTLVHGDVADLGLCIRILNEYQIQGVVHLAAQTQVRVANEHPLATLQSNVLGTWNMCEAARQCPKHLRFFIAASSDKAYGEPLTAQYDETHPLLATYPYDVSKACGDMICRSYAMTYELPIAITRCGNFFGPGDLNWDRLVPHVIESLLDGRQPVIRSNGKLVRDYFYVKDGAHAYLHLAERMLASPGAHRGEAFNFSYGEGRSVEEIVQLLARLVGRTDVRSIIRDEAAHEIAHQSLSSRKARETLGWKPIYDLESGLKETVAWYKTRTPPRS